MSAPKLTAAQVRALSHLVFVGRRLEVLTRGHDKRVTQSLVPLGLAALGESEFGSAFGATKAGRDWLRAHDAKAREVRLAQSMIDAAHEGSTDAGRAALAAHESEGAR